MEKGLSTSAKEEIIKKEFDSVCCERAFLSAVIHAGGSLLFAGKGKLSVLIKHICDGFNQRIDGALLRLYDIKSTFSGNELIIDSENILEILTDCKILEVTDEGGLGIEIVRGIDPSLVQRTCCASAYACGAFAAAGSLSVSKNGYHLEFSFEGADMASDFISLLSLEGISAKYTTRKDKHIVYIKDNDTIGDCLAFCCVGKFTLLISDMFVDRQIRQLSNRRLNCDMANLDRTISVGLRQAELFSAVLHSLTDDKLRQTALARINNPEASYDQLASLLNVTKSGIKHRLKKLEELANATKMN